MENIAALTLASMLLLSTNLLTSSARSDVIVPYEWIVPGAYAKYRGGCSYRVLSKSHKGHFLGS